MLFKNMLYILAFGLATVIATFQKIGHFFLNSGHLARGCLCLGNVESYVMGMFLFCFLFWYSCRAIIFAMAIGTTISFSLSHCFVPLS
jgi:hypothetical protein